jgi:YegS/Rv2252/BmrU family lipid kinase
MPADRTELEVVSESRSITQQRALILLNRKARHGKTAPILALERLREAGLDLIEAFAERPSRLSQIVREHKDRVDLVIVGGGDGTISQAADGLVDAQLPLGILPLGTANDLARTLGIPTDPIGAIEVILAGHQKKIDLGWVNGTHFFNVASIGLTSGLTRRLSRGSKSRWGVLAYLFAGCQVMIRSRPFATAIRCGNETVNVRTVQVTVGNGRHYGGGMTISDTAQIDDGTLHLYSLEVEHWWQILPLMPGLWRGTLSGNKRVRTLEGGEFEITPVKKRPKTIVADGEVSGRTPALLRIVPRAISVFVPRPTADAAE